MTIRTATPIQAYADTNGLPPTELEPTTPGCPAWCVEHSAFDADVVHTSKVEPIWPEIENSATTLLTWITRTDGSPTGGGENRPTLGLNIEEMDSDACRDVAAVLLRMADRLDG